MKIDEIKKNKEKYQILACDSRLPNAGWLGLE